MKRKVAPAKVVGRLQDMQRIQELERELKLQGDFREEAEAQRKRADALEYDCDKVADLNEQLCVELKYTQDKERQTRHRWGVEVAALEEQLRAAASAVSAERARTNLYLPFFCVAGVALGIGLGTLLL